MIRIGYYMPNDSPYAVAVHIGGWITVYFSYNEPVAFHSMWTGTVVSENIWSRTTGKHINRLCPDKGDRVPHAEFEKQYRSVCDKLAKCFKNLDRIDLMTRLEEASNGNDT